MGLGQQQNSLGAGFAHDPLGWSWRGNNLSFSQIIRLVAGQTVRPRSPWMPELERVPWGPWPWRLVTPQFVPELLAYRGDIGSETNQFYT